MTEKNDLVESYEELFKDRFTDKDEEYREYTAKPLPDPPCVENWYSRPKRTYDWSRWVLYIEYLNSVLCFSLCIVYYITLPKTVDMVEGVTFPVGQGNNRCNIDQMLLCILHTQ